jgi:D-alanyl-D-alanine carboxypeptidase
MGSLAGCTDDRTVRAGAAESADSTAASVAPSTSVNALPVTTNPPAPVPTSSTVAPTTSTVTPTTSTTPSTAPPATTEASAPPLLPASYPNLATAVFGLALDNVAVSISVHRDGVAPWGMAAGRRADGQDATTDSPFVIASVSKLVTALSIARLVAQGALTTDTAVPWASLGLRTDPLWADVTVRELLDHTSGMPINRKSWLDDPGPCAIPLQEAVVASPTIARTTWQYSNGNYCALGMLVESLTGRTLDEAAYDLVFTPAGVTGPYLSTDGMRSDSVPSPRGVDRLARLGGAGAWLASTDDLVAMLDSVTEADLEVLRWPGIIVDQYGWGHTGTLDGAKACAWVLEDGRTTVAAVVSGPRPATGGKVCDAVLPALALDLGIWAGDPLRNPI